MTERRADKRAEAETHHQQFMLATTRLAKAWHNDLAKILVPHAESVEDLISAMCIAFFGEIEMIREHYKEPAEREALAQMLLHYIKRNVEYGWYEDWTFGKASSLN